MYSVPSLKTMRFRYVEGPFLQDGRCTLSEAHQRALQVEKTITRRGGGELLSGNDSGTAARTCTSSGSPTSQAAAFSSDVVPRPVAHPKQQPRSPSGLRCFSYGDVKHIQSECKKVVFVEPEDSQEELVENIGVEPIFDEEEEVQEEDVGVGEEPQFDVVETMEEDLVDSDTGALEQRLCTEGQQFEEEDEAETRDELQFDGEEMVTEDWVEGDVGPLVMIRPAVITIIDDVKPEINEEECYSAPKFNKEVVLGRDDTAEVQGTAMSFRYIMVPAKKRNGKLVLNLEQGLRTTTEFIPTSKQIMIVGLFLVSTYCSGKLVSIKK
ncbi:hypothetical protein LWI28_024421 [Acer negundo]|uniref:Uncharacterized protein n=1 Tax=Acer negundo TaxID=4023 RepID=A0AAD5P4X6_ACENE|nr:hypothetical protein LWI28_024421 [Acer negundo]